MARLPAPEPPKRRHRRPARWLAGVLLAGLLLTAFGLGSVCLYVWLTGRQVDLTGREIVFDQIRADRENALSVPEVYERCRPWVVTLQVRSAGGGGGFGTGIVLTADGYILTCAHVVDLSDPVISVETCDGSVFDGTVVALDRQTDVAVVHIPALGLEPAELGSSGQTLVGETAIALGNPLGPQFSATLTCGILSARERTVTIDRYVMTLLQFDASVSPGNSGGPLLNSLGQVIGMVNAKVDDDQVEGIGFAIPIDDVLGIIGDLQNLGYVTGAYLGVTVQDVDSESASRYGLPSGAYVASVVDGGAADRAGVQPKDIITGIGDIQVTSMTSLTRALRSFKAGDTTTITVVRSGQTLTLTITLDERPQDLDSSSSQTDPSMPSEGDYNEWYDFFRRYFGN